MWSQEKVFLQYWVLSEVYWDWAIQRLDSFAMQFMFSVTVWINEWLHEFNCTYTINHKYVDTRLSFTPIICAHSRTMGFHRVNPPFADITAFTLLRRISTRFWTRICAHSARRALMMYSIIWGKERRLVLKRLCQDCDTVFSWVFPLQPSLYEADIVKRGHCKAGTGFWASLFQCRGIVML